MTVADLRRDYTMAGLTETDAGAEPWALFQRWFDQALAAKLPEPNSMALATSTPDGRPSVRIVLLKGFDARGFTFFTNHDGRKGRELAKNPQAAISIHWIDLERQVRAEGLVSRVDDELADDYFRSRPRGSQLGAWASPQSQVIEGRKVLEDRYAELSTKYPNDVPRPPNWGGYRLQPTCIEFWQGRPSRLHDRLRFTAESNSQWRRERLGP